jgi:hypothetical protein
MNLNEFYFKIKMASKGTIEQEIELKLSRQDYYR